MKVRITFLSQLFNSTEKQGGSLELLLGKVMKGDPGKEGKSAYSYAQDQGFKGTEEQFAKAMASVIIFEELGETQEVTI